MTENLIPLIMMRMAGLEVDECPKLLAKEPSDRNHSIYFPSAGLRISLHLKGIISFIPTRCPSKRELKELEEHYLLITPNLPMWDPHTDEFRDQ